MAEPVLTEELLQRIERSSVPDEFVGFRAFRERDLAAYLNEKLRESGMRRSSVIRAAGINETFGYQIFTGQRKASRDKVLALGLALGFDVHDMRVLLNHAGVADLYCKNRRDAIILFCVGHGMDNARTDAELFRFGEATIGDG